MFDAISADAQDQIFREARTRNGWHDSDVPEALIREVYDLMKWGPTSANNSPARFLWLKSEDAKKRLEPLLGEGNRPKTMGAPWTVICAWDWNFHEKIPELFPHNPGAKEWFADEKSRFDNGFRNGTLQAAYLMIAARALGLDCGPMSGFDMDGVNREFFESAEGEMKHWRTNFICNIGHGNDDNLFPRSPRLDFETACRVI
jgi:3-hydroxypropanoate dehydrogenase